MLNADVTVAWILLIYKMARDMVKAGLEHADNYEQTGVCDQADSCDNCACMCPVGLQVQRDVDGG